ncbi:NADP-dependent phosphogluconate dehydrogenase [Mesobaculum littorinae]|uniref:6-phosphogluconate dehydrogenase, decarboxylating n=1 Tax=Mesobaculum littorinae TaxID=2486419 RepID=A0A438AKK5_9RHOB|nr:NADP-dependent phosphogluconate dehydrogenase [Mesobaculum littorinae]RVV99200.1 NADP-dependent phosphogluconate dehydrogenase [Mesobaculum littorinae]
MARIGVIGTGVMGAALSLNMAEKGVAVAVHDLDAASIGRLIDRAGPLAENLTAAETTEALLAALPTPRAILVMVPSGAVDAVIDGLAPQLAPGDLIIDGGNSDFLDTRRREAALSERGLNFFGMGVSGGEEGARHGPSLMIGGRQEAWGLVEDILTAIAARHEGEPCAAWLGPDGAGHFVKTVHNGIEYADMQMIAEIYGIMRDGARQSAAEIGAMFEGWRTGPLSSYLIEITGQILAAEDPETGRPAVDVIRDSAGQKGTGRWTVIEALKLGQSASVIEAAVAARAWSSRAEARQAGAALFAPAGGGAGAPAVDELGRALLAARIIGFGQGLTLMRSASDAFDWDLDLARAAEIWRAGCIIRSVLLDDIAGAARAGLPEGELTHAPAFSAMLEETIPSLRRVVLAALGQGLPVPALAAALGYHDTMRQARGTANLIQAQRDVFGAHGFDYIDGRADRHGPWGA